MVDLIFLLQLEVKLTYFFLDVRQTILLATFGTVIVAVFALL